MKRKMKLLSILLCALMLTLTVFGGVSASAASPVGSSDGTYSVPVNLDGLTMGADNFSSTATVEKSGDFYYMSFGHSSSISNMKLVSGNKVNGYTSRTENGWTIYTYTLSASRLQGNLSFTAFITAMDKEVSFSISLNLAGATKTSDSIRDLGERPAEFVPVFTMEGEGNYQVSVGSVFAVPEASAVLGSEACDVSVSAYYLREGVKEPVEITDNRFTLSEVGEYHLIYKATHASYKTELGNDTYTELDFTITSVAGGSQLAKVEDEKGVLPEDTAIMARYITGGTVFDAASEKMATIADNFEVFSVSLTDANGSAVTPAENVKIYLKAKSTFDRNKIVVYAMNEDGSLTEIACDGYGKYVVFETTHTGNFIVCVPGVAFVMPMWGYALICVGAVVLIAGGIAAIVIIKKRKNKNQNKGNDTTENESSHFRR